MNDVAEGTKRMAIRLARSGRMNILCPDQPQNRSASYPKDPQHAAAMRLDARNIENMFGIQILLRQSVFTDYFLEAVARDDPV